MHDNAYIADVQRITLNVSCMMISHGRTKQLDTFCCITGFTNDFPFHNCGTYSVLSRSRTVVLICCYWYHHTKVGLYFTGLFFQNYTRLGWSPNRCHCPTDAIKMTAWACVTDEERQTDQKCTSVEANREKTNNNNNNPRTIFIVLSSWPLKVIARVHSVHLMNAAQHTSGCRPPHKATWLGLWVRL